MEDKLKSCMTIIPVWKKLLIKMFVKSIDGMVNSRVKELITGAKCDEAARKARITLESILISLACHESIKHENKP